MQAACSRQGGSDQWQCPDAAAAREPSPDESRDMLEEPYKCQMSLGAPGEQLLCSPGTCLLFVGPPCHPCWKNCVSSCCARLAAHAPALYLQSTLSFLLGHLTLPLFPCGLIRPQLCCCCWEVLLRQPSSLCISLCCVGCFKRARNLGKEIISAVVAPAALLSPHQPSLLNKANSTQL